MKTITLQTKGVSLEVKEKAEERAIKEGFRSVHDIIRLVLVDYSKGRLTLGRTWGVGHDPEVQEAIDEYKQGKTTEIPPHQSPSDHFNEIYGDKEVQD